MSQDSLKTFLARARRAFADGEPIVPLEHALSELVRAPDTEPWLHALRAAWPEREELYRDPSLGFLLLAHSEPTGLYRPPHDHGQSWVVYALQHGEMEVGTYERRVEAGAVQLFRRDVSHLRAGDVRVYRRGDIHDTRCLAGPSLYFRFTERDLALEERAGRLTRYAARDGVWTAETP